LAFGFWFGKLDLALYALKFEGELVIKVIKNILKIKII
jgi:hypothetical protein